MNVKTNERSLVPPKGFVIYYHAVLALLCVCFVIRGPTPCLKEIVDYL